MEVVDLQLEMVNLVKQSTLAIEMIRSLTPHPQFTTTTVETAKPSSLTQRTSSPTILQLSAPLFHQHAVAYITVAVKLKVNTHSSLTA